jgi:cysteine desulfurase/selenocysteine lyase
MTKVTLNPRMNANAAPIEPEHELRELVAGVETEVPILGGGRRRYVNLDNAASTPPLKAVLEAVIDFSDWYSSVHRGTGLKSLLSTQAYESARRAVMDFVGADPEHEVIIFTKHATEALNLVAQKLVTSPEEVVLTTELEHHANLLPWRSRHRVEYVGVDKFGQLDEEDLFAKLDGMRGQVRLLALSGASNVTGYLPDIHRIAALAHQAGAQVLVDAAQLVAHRQLNVEPVGSPGHLDFVVFSAHKIYAPFGAGVVVGPRSFFESVPPMLAGGGAVEIVTLEDTLWSDTPDRDEAGSPNVIGAVALGIASRMLQKISFARIAAHERRLTDYALEQLRRVDDLQILGNGNGSSARDRIGVISFNLQGQPHQKVAAALGYEHGVGVRAGCFCAHPYMLRLLGVSASEARQVRAAIQRGDRSAIPGAVRMSFGLYNTREDIDRMVQGLQAIASGKSQTAYDLNRETGEFIPVGAQLNLEAYLAEALGTAGVAGLL